MALLMSSRCALGAQRPAAAPAAPPPRCRDILHSCRCARHLDFAGFAVSEGLVSVQAGKGEKSEEEQGLVERGLEWLHMQQTASYRLPT